MLSQQKVTYAFRIITIFCVGIFFLEILFLKLLPEFENQSTVSSSFTRQTSVPTKKTSDQRRKTGPEIRKYFRLTYISQYFHSIIQLLVGANSFPRFDFGIVVLVFSVLLPFLFFYDSRRVIGFYYIFVASN